MGRPTKLTPDRQRVLVDAIRAGNFYEVACAAADVDYSTFRRWMVAGEEGRGKAYSEFREAITRAESAAERDALTHLQNAMPADWRAAMAFLERRYPDRWGRRDRVAVDQQVQARVAVEETPDALIERLQRQHPELANALIDALFVTDDAE